MATSVKICGLREPEMVRSILHLPIDQIGFVFAKSKRQVTPLQAEAMIRVLQERRASGEQTPLSVGVLVDPDQNGLEAILRVAHLDVIQLHGKESPQLCAWIKHTYPGIQVWKVISVTQAQQLADAAALDGTGVTWKKTNRAIDEVLNPYKSYVDAILLDTYDPVYGGGSGLTFAWDAIPPYQQWCKDAGIKLLVAGGLQADNVGELVEVYAPDGVDVSSGVETDGVKDIIKITSFVERVKRK